MSPVESDEVQARLTLIGYLYKETLKGASGALELAGQAPLGAEEKELLFGEVERAVWGFDASLFEDAPARPEEWVARVEDSPVVREALEGAVERVLAARRA